MSITSDRSTYETTKSRVEEIVRETGQYPELCAGRIMQVVCTHYVPLNWYTSLALTALDTMTEIKGEIKKIEKLNNAPEEGRCG